MGKESTDKSTAQFCLDAKMKGKDIYRLHFEGVLTHEMAAILLAAIVIEFSKEFTDSDTKEMMLDVNYMIEEMGNTKDIMTH